MSIASELNNYRNGLDDAWDAAEDMGATIPHDRNMVNLDDAIRTIPVSSPNDGVLTITQNGTTIQTFSADQATNVTAALTDTTYSNFTGATSSVAGTAGLVPAPAAGDDTKFLSGDGTWATVQSGGSTVTLYPKFTSPNLVFEGLFKDQALTEEAYGMEIVQMMRDGTVLVDMDIASRGIFKISYGYDGDEGVHLFEAYGFQMVAGGGQGSGCIRMHVRSYQESTGSYSFQHVVLQPRLTAGSNITISDTTISATDTTYSDFTGATSSVAGAHGLVPAPSAGDEGKALHGDGTWKDTTAKLVEMSYGESNAWTKFINAYNAGSIVYCRASSNSNPASGSQTRKAFMAYVNNAASPTNVEFQYVRSASSKTDSQQTDQVFVYTLTNSNGGTWSVASRNMGPKINVSGPITKTFTSGANATITIGADAMTGATSSTAGAAGVVPKPNSGDQGKFLKGDGTWAAPILTSYSTTEQDTNMTWINGEKIYRKVFTFDTQENQSYSVDISGSNIGEITNMFTTFKQNQDGSGATAFAPYANNNFDWIILVQRAKTSNTDTLFYYHGSQVANLRYGTTVLEYTKTGSEGSGGASD